MTIFWVFQAFSTRENAKKGTAKNERPTQQKNTRRRWNRTTGTLIPHGFEVQALNPQSSSTQNAGCEDRTHDLWIMRPTLYQLSQPSLLEKIFEARIELATSSVLDWRDNQLHHPNIHVHIQPVKPHFELPRRTLSSQRLRSRSEGHFLHCYVSASSGCGALGAEVK